ncbi:FGGY-family carbohydrate kinase [Klebsiella pneumoniae]
MNIESLVFAGGGSKGALWSQILSDVTGLPVRVPVVREATALGCAIAAGTGAGLYGDMASTGERLVSWHREFTPNPQHRELYQEMMSKWQTVYADQLGLVDSGLTTSMWQAPGLERRQRVALPPHPNYRCRSAFPPSPFGRGPGVGQRFAVL